MNPKNVSRLIIGFYIVNRRATLSRIRWTAMTFFQKMYEMVVNLLEERRRRRDRAEVYDNATVYGDVYGDAKVFGSAEVSTYAEVNVSAQESGASGSHTK